MVDLSPPSDTFFGKPFIDVDEWREEPQRHRYVHGGFEDTDTRFSFYFPPAEDYGDRFIHLLGGGGGGTEHSARVPSGTWGAIDMAFAFGAYLVESNQGHTGNLRGLKGDRTVLLYRANREVALFARCVAEEMYGAEPAHGYLYGGSGGGMRTIQGLENTSGLYDGGVAYMIIPPHYTAVESIRLNAARLLRHKVASIVDASDPGGSGNPFEGLDSREREALAAYYRAGWPRRGGELMMDAPVPDVPAIHGADRSFVDDFWSVPGYLGADGYLDGDLIEETVRVKRLVMPSEVGGRSEAARSHPATDEYPVGLVLEGGIADRMVMYERLTFTSGAAEGRRLYAQGVVDDVVLCPGVNPLEGVQPGDEVAVDNRLLLATCYLHRYSSDPREFLYPDNPSIDGVPVYPQRPHLPSPAYLSERPTGRFAGKLLLIQHEMDTLAPASAAVFYHQQVEATMGDAVDDRFRIWWVENAQHFPGSAVRKMTPAGTTRFVELMGQVEQGLAHLIEWVEGGTPPPSSTRYRWTRDSRLELPGAAGERAGIQPVVHARANGRIRADVAAGEPVRLEVTAEAPAGAGTIVAAEWDLDGSGTFARALEGVDGSSTVLRATFEHAFDAPGTYFPTVRVHTHRSGRPGAPVTVSNLGRVRVVVS